MKKPVAFVFCIIVICVVIVVKLKNDETTENTGRFLPCYGFTSIYGILIDPEQSETIYVISDDGIYMSSNGGKAWRDMDDSTQAESDLEIFVKTYGRFTAPIINSHRSDIRYDLKDNRIRKSINGGIDWIINDEVQGCHALVIDQQNPKVLYSYCKTGPHENKTEETSEGIYKSINAGEDWNLVLPGAVPKPATVYIAEGARIATFVIDPTHSENIYVGLLGQGVYRSTDGGSRWENVFQKRGDIIAFLVIDPIHTDTLYVGTWLRGVYKSTDRGLNWSHIFGGYASVENRVEESIPILSLAIDPQNSDIIYIGTGYHGIFKSIDGGKSWMSVSERLPCEHYSQ